MYFAIRPPELQVVQKFSNWKILPGYQSFIIFYLIQNSLWFSVFVRIVSKKTLYKFFLVLHNLPTRSEAIEREFFFEHFWIENLKQARFTLIEKGRHTKHTAEDTFYSSSDKRTYNTTEHITDTGHTYIYTRTYEKLTESLGIVLRRQFWNVIHSDPISSINQHFYHILTVSKEIRLCAILIVIKWYRNYFHSRPVHITAQKSN